MSSLPIPAWRGAPVAPVATASAAPSSVGDTTQSLAYSAALQADRLLAVLVVLSSLVGVMIGQINTSMTLPLIAGVVLSVLAVGSLLLAPASTWTRFALPLLLCCTVVLHIQASMGMLEFHFGVFVSLALVMVYRDWRVVLGCALFFAVHHVLFDRLQAWGYGVYCTTEPDFPKVLLHAAFVVAQTGVEMYVVHHMNQAFRMGSELNDLVQRVDQPQSVSLDMAHTDLYTRVAQRLQQVFGRMHDTLQDVKISASALHAASAGIASGSEQLSERCEHARQSVEETASAAHQIQQTVASTAQIAQQAQTLAQAAAADAQNGGQKVRALVQDMQTIARGSKEIASIVDVVEGLAFQTNLLALNAAVEAARAGEQGRGFAVVADEVRRLALRSSEAAKDIHRQIGQSVQSVSQGVGLSEQVQIAMEGFEGRIAEVAARMQEIADASQQQHEGIALISQSIMDIEDVTARNAEMAERTRHTAGDIQARAQQMLAQAALFRTRSV